MSFFYSLSDSVNSFIAAWVGQEFWLTRFVFLRALGFIYFIAFLSLLQQFKPLFGANGLLPAQLYLERVAQGGGSLFSLFWKLPSIFWFHISDHFMMVCACVGVLLSAAVMLGLSNGCSMLVLWLIYMSFVHVGQVFFGYGWESLLLETGFLAIFLYPFFNLSFFPAHHPPPKLVLLLITWVLFRNMFGSGLIKIRGSECWRDLSCLFYHFETQPLPNPLSPYLHHLPKWMLKVGVFFNHFVELIVPFGLFLTAPLRIFSGFLTALFQFFLIISGNLSFLNWLTLVTCIPSFDDRVWRPLFPQWMLSKIPEVSMVSTTHFLTQLPYWILGISIGFLSINPIKNFFSQNQAMNRSYDPFHLVNSYGAFGHVGMKRFECVIKGADNLQSNHWIEYDFKAKPGEPTRSHPIIAPYHYRLDWQIWFAAMGSYQHNPWLVHFVYKLLHNDAASLGLIQPSPFKDKAPRYIKIDLYEYKFPQKGYRGSLKWDRRFIKSYLPPLSADNPSLIDYIRANGWKLYD
tara:strand:+ start:3715 stop:5265 length:1551 start_codon:yes stop_codon:yes gene_type:complete